MKGLVQLNVIFLTYQIIFHWYGYLAPREMFSGLIHICLRHRGHIQSNLAVFDKMNPASKGS